MKKKIPIERTFRNYKYRMDAIENLKTAKMILDAMKIPFFLGNGTLLGCIRNHDLIPHDNDIDLGIDSKYVEYADTIVEGFKDENFVIHGVFGTPDDGLELSFRRYKSKIDIFFYYDEDNKSTMSVWGDNIQYKYKYPKIDKMTRVSFLENIYFIPKNYEQYLEAQYGNWEETEKDWDYLQSPRNVEQEFKWNKRKK